MLRKRNVRLPLVGAAADATAKALLTAGKFAISKPERKVAGSYISDRIALRKPVQVCELCWRKDYGWWRKVDYRPDWDTFYMSDCHNCSRRFVNVYMFLHEGSFFGVLHPDHHGNRPEPNRKVYFTI